MSKEDRVAFLTLINISDVIKKFGLPLDRYPMILFFGCYYIMTWISLQLPLNTVSQERSQVLTRNSHGVPKSRSRKEYMEILKDRL